jgi:hypothetical protein
MNDEQKFLFDLTGYLVIPEVISRAQAQEVREQIRSMRTDPAQLPPAARGLPGGKIAGLIDHPVVVDVLHEVIGADLRLEACHTTWREYGQADGQDMHQGGPTPEPWFHYHVVNGKIDAAMCRVVWELEDVGPDDGGTVFLVGSHKANFKVPAAVKDLTEGKRSPYIHGYSCPAGSVVVFTENLAHAGPVWKNRDHARVAVFFAYNHLCINHHRPNFSPEAIAAMTPGQQAFFRGAWNYDFTKHVPNTVEEGLVVPASAV